MIPALLSCNAPPSVVAPVTPSVPVIVVLPPTERSVVAPLNVTSSDNVDVPVTPNVPPTVKSDVAP